MALTFICDRCKVQQPPEEPEEDFNGLPGCWTEFTLFLDGDDDPDYPEEGERIPFTLCDECAMDLWTWVRAGKTLLDTHVVIEQ